MSVDLAEGARGKRRRPAPDEYARRVVENVDELEPHARDRHLATAMRLGTAEQRAAIDAFLESRPGSRR